MGLDSRIVLVVLLLAGACGGSSDPMYGAPYDAYANAGGPRCGVDAVDNAVYCEPGDHCQDWDSATCVTALDGTYDAYYGAGGPFCGYDAVDVDVYCEPGDTCLDEETARCGASGS
jgi:hypothetical protein